MNDLDTSGKASVLDGFYGCYLLVSLNPRCAGRTYIGYTVNPKRRINQHNSGSQHGGAKSTSGKGPWLMTLIVHGFPNDIAALRFEWAWQNPYQSRRIPYIPPKTKRESPFQFRFRILCNMLRVCPWNRLGLTIRWLNQEYVQEFPVGLAPPLHMPIAFGAIEPSPPIVEDQSNLIPGDMVCQLCTLSLKDDSSRNETVLVCPSYCEKGFWHLLCLARHFTPNDPKELIPLRGNCPACGAEILWPELIGRQKFTI